MDALRKKELKNAAREADRSAFIERMPLDPETARRMFDFLDAALQDHGCEHDHRLSTEAITELELTPVTVLPWLKENGGGCDCEVIANVEPRVDGAFEWDR